MIAASRNGFCAVAPVSPDEDDPEAPFESWQERQKGSSAVEVCVRQTALLLFQFPAAPALVATAPLSYEYTVVGVSASFKSMMPF